MNQLVIRTVVVAVLLTAIVLLQPAVAVAQATQPQEMVKAQALMQAKNYDGAIKLLEEYVHRIPAAAPGWLLLGNVYRQKGDLDKAIEANLKVTQPRLMRLQGNFNAAG